MSMSRDKKLRVKKEKPLCPPGRKVRRAWDVSNERVRDALCGMAFMGPSLLGVLVFFIVPFLVVVYYAVIRSPINPEFVFLDNFIAVLQNSSFQTAAKNTATFSAVAVPLAVVLSLGPDAGVPHPGEELAEDLLPQPHDGAGGLGGTDLAGGVPL